MSKRSAFKCLKWRCRRTNTRGAALHRRLAAIAGGRSLHLEPLESRVLLSTILVDSTGDTVAVDGQITLREAILAANTDSAVGDAPAGAGDDVIIFDNSLKGATIALSGSHLSIESGLAIQGHGADELTIDAGGMSRVFTISGGVTASIEGMTITGGVASVGGGIENQGNLTLTAVTITGNAADLNGGGIYNLGDVTVIASTIENNTVAQFHGGAIDNSSGLVVVVNSTISGNQSTQGGAIYTGGGTVILTNSTVHDNTSSFGGGIYILGNATLHNTIVSGNHASNDIEGPLNGASSFNLIGVGGGIANGVNNNQVGVTDPRLGPLMDNGGPTLTHALLSDSPAINAGDDAKATAAGLSTDQRGASRFVDTVDVGAFELAQIDPLPDLLAIEFEVLDLEPLVPGQLFTYRLKVQNQGSADAGRFAVDLYLSKDPDIDPSVDKKIGDFEFISGLAVSMIGGTNPTIQDTLPGPNDPFWIGNGLY